MRREDWTPRWYRGEANTKKDAFAGIGAYGAVLFK